MPTPDQLTATVDACRDLIRTRFPEGEEGAAAMLLEDGTILTSTAPEVFNASVELCHEVGAFCEAYKLDQAVVASVCLFHRADGSMLVLSPCGVCQERLIQHGPDVLVATAALPATDEIAWRTLREVHPAFWGRVLDSSPWPPGA
ncbi:cytidine deaminase [Luteipulveratus halotolerans]|nr:cytidine deaminase [Luteipulveratus halotolerans]